MVTNKTIIIDWYLVAYKYDHGNHSLVMYKSVAGNWDFGWKWISSRALLFQYYIHDQINALALEKIPDPAFMRNYVLNMEHTFDSSDEIIYLISTV